MRYSTVVLLGAAMVAAQGRITKPPAQPNSNGSGQRKHVATMRSSDSTDGSRVALSSDQSLNDYEAYRRGDRFYVKIPAADVPRAEALRGRGFADVKTQRAGDSTVLSFRLQPGSTARVEQRANHLEVVFTVPGGSSSSNTANTGRQSSASNKGANRNSNTASRIAPSTLANKNSSSKSASSSQANKNASTSTAPNRNANANQRGTSPSSLENKAAKIGADRSTSGGVNSNSSSKTGLPGTLALNSGLKTAATPLPSPVASPSAAKGPTASPRSNTTALASPTAQPTQATTTGQSNNQSRQDWWSRAKERLNYWILLAQLNPIPVAVGVGVFLLLLGLLFLQRRRARAPKRVRAGKTKTSTTAKKEAASSVQPATEAKPAPIVAPAVEAAVIPSIVAAAPIAAAAAKEPEVVPVPVSSTSAATPSSDAPRRERIGQVAEETKKLMNGGPYDESVIGSADGETRQLVGAELLSAIVGRNATRRENARAAFMKHGYFDDATRDLRVADSPNERAAAARRLSFVHDPEATPHLVGALDDQSPDVRRAAVEALMDIRDPAAIGPLNALMQIENDRKVPRTLIKHAIEACATAPPDEQTSVAAPIHTPEALPDPSSHATETEREVIEL